MYVMTRDRRPDPELLKKHPWLKRHLSSEDVLEEKDDAPMDDSSSEASEGEESIDEGFLETASDFPSFLRMLFF